MTDTYAKIDEATILHTKTVQTVTPCRHTVTELIAHRADIIRQRDEQVSARNTELAEVDAMLREAAKLGLPDAVVWDKANPVVTDDEKLIEEPFK